MMPMELAKVLAGLIYCYTACPEFGNFMMNGTGEVRFRRKNVGLDAGEVGC